MLNQKEKSNKLGHHFPFKKIKIFQHHLLIKNTEKKLQSPRSDIPQSLEHSVYTTRLSMCQIT